MGLSVGIPPTLRTYRDRIFDYVPSSVNIAIEIGCGLGWFSWRCAKFLPETAKLFCVDPFSGDDGQYRISCWKKVTKDRFGKSVFLKRGDPSVVACDFKNIKIDFVFFDAIRLDYPVLDCLRSWFNLVRPGGMFVGTGIDDPRIKAGVKLFAEKNKISDVHFGPFYSFSGKQSSLVWWIEKDV